MYRVKDYKFETEQEAKEAQSELRAVDYLRTKINMDQPEAALEIYKQLLDQDIFHTIAGYDFLKGLQNFLRTSAAINNADIPQIPDALAQSVLPKLPEQKEEAKPEVKPAASAPEQKAEAKPTASTPENKVEVKPAVSTPENKPEVKPAVSVPEQKPEVKPAVSAPKKPVQEPIPLEQLTPVPKLNEAAAEKAAAEPAAAEPAPQPKKKAAKSGSPDGRYRTMAMTFAATTAILFVAVVVMFVITLTSDNPTIINYETKLINKYATWEEELSQKETELKSREADIEFREEALHSQTFAPVSEPVVPAAEEQAATDEADGQTDEAGADGATSDGQTDNGADGEVTE